MDATSNSQLRLEIDLGVQVKGVRLDVEELEIDLDERPEGEADEIVDRASAARNIEDLEREVVLLEGLEEQAQRLRDLDVDTK